MGEAGVRLPVGPQMKFFIGYLIEGEAAVWHNDLARDISEKFNIWNIADTRPPHITIFRPFETESIETILGLLEDWTAGHPLLGKLAISNFGNFDDKVVFADVAVDGDVMNAISDLRAGLHGVPGMPSENHPEWRPHATLAYQVEPAKIKAIRDYVSKLDKPNFNLAFDNVTIFRSEDDRKWSVWKRLDI